MKVLDQLAKELVTIYLTNQIAQGYSPHTAQAERSALRLLFENRDLGASVNIPVRRREEIKRSRYPAVRDRDFQPANWQSLIRFLQITGLRRAEVSQLQIENIHQDIATGRMEIRVKRGHGKGGKIRNVPALPGYEQEVQTLCQNRDPQELVFSRIPSHLDIQAIRREYAQALYLYYAPDRELPPKKGRSRRRDYDYAAAQRVSWALGHNRVDVVLRHYLR